MLLALDTSTAVVGAAVCHDGRVLGAGSREDGRRHAELLAPMVQQAMDRAGVGWTDLEAVAVGVGPGPFTGLRVGLVTAVVLGHARSLPTLGLCSLDALAAAALADPQLRDDLGQEFLVATDARRREVYWARYRIPPRGKGGVDAAMLPTRVDGPGVAAAVDLPEAWRALPCVGRGGALYPHALRHVAGPLDVDAGVLGLTVELARREAPSMVLPPDPLYLRRPDAVAAVASAGSPL